MAKLPKIKNLKVNRNGKSYTFTPYEQALIGRATLIQLYTYKKEVTPPFIDGLMFDLIRNYYTDPINVDFNKLKEV